MQSRQQVREILQGVMKECQKGRRVKRNVDQDIWDDYGDDLLCGDENAKETREGDIRKKNGSPRFNLGSVVSRASKTLKEGSAWNAGKNTELFPSKLTELVQGFPGLAGLPRMEQVFAWR